MLSSAEPPVAALTCQRCGHQWWILTDLVPDAVTPMLTTADLARLLNVTADWIHHNMEQLPTPYRLGRTYRWKREEVATWLQHRRWDNMDWL